MLRTTIIHLNAVRILSNEKDTCWYKRRLRILIKTIMPQVKTVIRHKNAFVVKKSKPRKVQSRSPLKFDSEQMKRELGPELGAIDIRIGNLQLKFDSTQGIWISDEKIHGDDLERRKNELDQENSLLSIKLDILLDMLAQATAEEELADQTKQE
ncbi:unnamed protein product [Adineta ricciae]|uniref:Uncharacterized protein n=1 Tax=Adineta ricciae TaxID=249248 RepID=A0A814B7J8_ADIRI|nr:unnamed protein product [Adineta ricciae]